MLEDHSFDLDADEGIVQDTASFSAKAQQRRSPGADIIFSTLNFPYI